MFYFATESGDHVIKILICDWSVFNVVVVVLSRVVSFVCIYLTYLIYSVNMSWTDRQIETLISFYSCNEFLYDPSCNDYHNRTKRRLFMDTLGKEVGMNGMRITFYCCSS